MSHTDTLLLVICIILGVAVLMQIVFLVVLAVMGGKAMKMAKEYRDEVRSVVTPAIHNARELLEASKSLVARLEPKLDAAASDIAEMTKVAREETQKIQASADEISERIRRQAERMDNMTTSTLNGVERAAHFVEGAVHLPVRQVAGIFAAAKAIVEALRSPNARRRAPRSAHADD